MNLFKKLRARFSKKNKSSYRKIPDDIRMSIIEKACQQVSRGVFFSTIIIIASFLPVFLLRDILVPGNRPVRRIREKEGSIFPKIHPHF